MTTRGRSRGAGRQHWYYFAGELREKKSFGSKEEASVHAKYDRQVYRCGHCRSFHVGRPSKRVAGKASNRSILWLELGGRFGAPRLRNAMWEENAGSYQQRIDAIVRRFHSEDNPDLWPGWREHAQRMTALGAERARRSRGQQQEEAGP